MRKRATQEPPVSLALVVLLVGGIGLAGCDDPPGPVRLLADMAEPSISIDVSPAQGQRAWFGHADLFDADRCRTDYRLSASLNGAPVELTPAQRYDSLGETTCVPPLIELGPARPVPGSDGDTLVLTDGYTSKRLRTHLTPVRELVLVEPADGVLHPLDTAVLEWRGEAGGGELISASLGGAWRPPPEARLDGRRISFQVPAYARGEEVLLTVRLEEYVALEPGHPPPPGLEVDGWDWAEVNRWFEVSLSVPLAP